ncbi:MAG: hypothetical protein GX896_10325 [Clostridiales bacterium]|nr:hypothetical protein [Clostridiales bacterium]
MKKFRPSRYALHFLRISMIGISVLATYLFLRYLSPYQILMYVLIGLFWSMTFLFGVILLPIYFSRTTYNVSQEFVMKNSGMIFTSKQFMRGSSIQYITTSILPLSSATSFNFIIINALGGKMILSFLSKSDALEITATLNRGIEKRR